MPNINKNIIIQAGAAVANATNKAAGLSASTPEPGTIISAIQLVNGGRKIGPDALAHFTESVRNKLLSLLVCIDPIQDFNGYGHPWPGGGGKNLLNPATMAPGYLESSGNVHAQGDANEYYSTEYYEVGSQTAISVGYNAFTSSEAKWIAINWYDANKTNLSRSAINESISTFSPASGAVYFRVSMRTYGHGVDNCYCALGSDTTFAPYSNICPISGRTGANAYVSPTPNVADATTYVADWTTPAGAVYAGSADIVSGDIKAAPYYASYNGETLVGPWVSSMDVYDPDGTPTTGAQVVDLGGAMTDYHITGQDIITLVGENYIWSDSGDVTITE